MRNSVRDLDYYCAWGGPCRKRDEAEEDEEEDEEKYARFVLCQLRSTMEWRGREAFFFSFFIFHFSFSSPLFLLERGSGEPAMHAHYVCINTDSYAEQFTGVGPWRQVPWHSQVHTKYACVHTYLVATTDLQLLLTSRLYLAATHSLTHSLATLWRIGVRDQTPARARSRSEQLTGGSFRDSPPDKELVVLDPWMLFTMRDLMPAHGRSMGIKSLDLCMSVLCAVHTGSNYPSRPGSKTQRKLLRPLGAQALCRSRRDSDLAIWGGAAGVV